MPNNNASTLAITKANTASSMVIGSASPIMLAARRRDRKSTRLNSSHRCISYAVFCLKKKRRWRRLGTGSNKQRIFSAKGDVGGLTVVVRLAAMVKDVLVSDPLVRAGDIVGLLQPFVS